MNFCCQSDGWPSSPSKRQAIEAESESRRARIVPILPTPSRVSLCSGIDPPPPPRYEDATHDTRIQYTGGDEKHVSDEAAVRLRLRLRQHQHQHQQHPNILSPPRYSRPETPRNGDDDDNDDDNDDNDNGNGNHNDDDDEREADDSRSVISSIVSIPSTQVTGITMARTATGTGTVRRDLTGQTNTSFVTSSRPPSYAMFEDGGTYNLGERVSMLRAASPASLSSSSSGPGGILRHPVMGQDWWTWVDGVIEGRSRNVR